MMRHAWPLLLLGVGCDSLLAPMVTIHRPPVAIDLLRVSSPDIEDFGAQGLYDAQGTTMAQTLMYDPLSRAAPEEQHIVDVQASMRTMGESATHAALSVELGPIVEDSVGPLSGWTVSATIGGDHVFGSVWSCETPGTRMVLVTIGSSESRTRRVHDRSLASAVCGSTPLVDPTSDVLWELPNPLIGWTVNEALGANVWDRASQLSRVVLEASSPVPSTPTVPRLCSAALRARHDIFVRDESIVGQAHDAAERPDGCSLDWTAPPGFEDPARGRYVHTLCGERAVDLTCFAYTHDGDLDTLCNMPWSCKTAE